MGRARRNTEKRDWISSRQGYLAVTGFQARREGSSCRGIRAGNGGESNERNQTQTKQPEKEQGMPKASHWSISILGKW